METVYKKYRPADEILMEYYWYVDHLSLEEKLFKEEMQKFQGHIDKLYRDYLEAVRQEKKREASSKSARIAKKLEQMKLTEDLIKKIKVMKA